jgi:hypothetical protein
MREKLRTLMVALGLTVGTIAVFAQPSAITAQGICENYCSGSCGGPTSPWGLCLELDGCSVSQGECYYLLNSECDCPEELPSG